MTKQRLSVAVDLGAIRLDRETMSGGMAEATFTLTLWVAESHRINAKTLPCHFRESAADLLKLGADRMLASFSRSAFRVRFGLYNPMSGGDPDFIAYGVDFSSVRGEEAAHVAKVLPFAAALTCGATLRGLSEALAGIAPLAIVPSDCLTLGTRGESLTADDIEDAIEDAMRKSGRCDAYFAAKSAA